MGYYIETGTLHDKAKMICTTEPTAEEVTLTEAAEAVKDPAVGVIVVVNNGPFEAAAFAYSEAEFQAFTQPNDLRPKKYVVMDRQRAEVMSGYK